LRARRPVGVACQPSSSASRLWSRILLPCPCRTGAGVAATDRGQLQVAQLERQQITGVTKAVKPRVSVQGLMDISGKSNCNKKSKHELRGNGNGKNTGQSEGKGTGKVPEQVPKQGQLRPRKAPWQQGGLARHPATTAPKAGQPLNPWLQPDTFLLKQTSIVHVSLINHPQEIQKTVECNPVVSHIVEPSSCREGGSPLLWLLMTPTWNFGTQTLIPNSWTSKRVTASRLARHRPPMILQYIHQMVPQALPRFSTTNPVGAVNCDMLMMTSCLPRVLR